MDVHLSTLRTLQLRRTHLVARMESLLDSQADLNSYRRKLILELSERITSERLRYENNLSALIDLQALNARLATDNQHRQASFEAQRHQLRVNFALGGPHEASKLVHDLRYLSLSSTSLEDFIKKEQSLVASQILSMFAIRLESHASNIYSTLGLILPTSVSQLSTHSQPKEATNAALGYFTLLVDLMGYYFGGVQLSESIFQASRSVVYTTTDFWNRKPKNADSIQPLYIEDIGPALKGLESKGLPSDECQSDLASAFTLLNRSAYCLLVDLFKSNALFSSPIHKVQAFLSSFSDEPPDISQPQYAIRSTPLPPLSLLRPTRSEQDSDFNDWVKL